MLGNPPAFGLRIVAGAEIHTEVVTDEDRFVEHESNCAQATA